ncbi:hypothetical protein FALBO_5260 [Fusarium albosuccineum]|uniref:Uncharacterized protein n=1 Tax=Fusarium albosuccineum TaxID=1237068 RepID=A0A8H4LDW3_9HYPO|nr:hypothetical protein FALBO_5260 [Fusarium albosuccineum]
MPRKITRHFRLGRHPSSNAKATAQVPAKEREIKARRPVPLDSTRPSTAKLPGHVVHAILGLLQHVHPEALQAVALVSSSMYHQARYAQHQHVRIDLDRPKHALNRLSLISRLGHAVAVQEVRVTGCKTPNQDDVESRTQVLARLAGMMPSMTGLRDFGWNVSGYIPGTYDGSGSTSVPIPSDILAALPRASPYLVRLHTSLCSSALEGSHLEARTFLHDLEGNHNLSTLSVDVIYTNDLMCRDTMRALKRVLLSCPNLSRLPQINVHYPRVAYCDGQPMDPYCGLGFAGDEKPPPLQELGVLDYPWGTPAYTGYPIRARETLHWASTFDWSRLARLNHVPDSLYTIAPYLTALRELALDEPSSIEMELLDDIASPLEILSFSSWKRVGNEPKRITKFAATLRQLRVHENESSWGYGSHGLITTPDLMHLSTRLPNLEHLALDMERDKETQQWPYAALDATAAFPSLHTVELWFALGDQSLASKPVLTISSAHHLGDYLRERNENIQRVTLHSGAPRPYSGRTSRRPLGSDFYIPGPSWAQCNSVTFEYQMVYDAEAMNLRRSRVICLDLGSGMNARLRHLAQGAVTRRQMNLGELNADEIRLIAALDGPLSKVEWDAWSNKQPEVIAYRADMHREAMETEDEDLRIVLVFEYYAEGGVVLHSRLVDADEGHAGFDGLALMASAGMERART